MLYIIYVIMLFMLYMFYITHSHKHISNIDNKIIDRNNNNRIAKLRIGHTNITYRELIELDRIG